MNILLRTIWFWMPILLLYPMWTSSQPSILGFPDSDAYKHVWGHWWVRTCYSKEQSPFTRMCFPGGGKFCLDTLHSISVGTHLMDGIGVELQCWDCTATDGRTGDSATSSAIGMTKESFGYQRFVSSLFMGLAFQLSGVSEHMILPQSLDRLLLSSFLY